MPGRPEPDPLHVRLARTLELSTTLHFSEWPGFTGPLIHIPDPAAPSDRLAREVADRLAPQYRVISIQLRADVPMQAHVVDILRLLDAFGFAAPVFFGERAGARIGLVFAAWYPRRIAGLVLVDAVAA